jgi:uncharacterized tellurite resistance protein B-like protein
MERVSDLLGGGLKPGDPRRFLVDAMVGAMTADGRVDPRELEVVRARIAEHPLFQAVSGDHADIMIELSQDALRYAGGAIARAPAIARGLPSRIHRLTAFGMAAEVAAADNELARSELDFLEALRIAARISPSEGRQLVAAARARQLGGFLDKCVARLLGLTAIAAEIYALRALARGDATDAHRLAVAELFAAMPDLAMPTEQLGDELYQAFHRPRAADAQVFGELEQLVDQLPDAVDRYWMMVYALVAEPPDAIGEWRAIPFAGVMQAAFQINDTDMELAVVDALAYPRSLPRPV